MANQHNTSCEHFQRICQGIDTLHIQVVGGLVQEQNVRLGEVYGCKDHTGLLSSAQFHYRCEVIVTFQSKLSNDRSHVCGLHSLGWEHSQQILHRILVHLKDIHKVLRVAPYPQLLAPPGVTFSWGELPRNEIEQRRFASTIGTDNSHLGSHIYTKVEVAQSKVLSCGVLEGNIDQLDQGGVQFCGLWEGECHLVIVPLGRLFRSIIIIINIIVFALLALLLIL
mmetsp:Transcript_17823/g.21357  ORF Transcript_17823/g.21357 Transcript_17823/m.21357 type:complete len:224 (-) Transcript_17823:1614-2285(-)